VSWTKPKKLQRDVQSTNWLTDQPYSTLSPLRQTQIGLLSSLREMKFNSTSPMFVPSIRLETNSSSTLKWRSAAGSTMNSCGRSRSATLFLQLVTRAHGIGKECLKSTEREPSSSAERLFGQRSFAAQWAAWVSLKSGQNISQASSAFKARFSTRQDGRSMI